MEERLKPLLIWTTDSQQENWEQVQQESVSLSVNDYIDGPPDRFGVTQKTHFWGCLWEHFQRGLTRKWDLPREWAAPSQRVRPQTELKSKIQVEYQHFCLRTVEVMWPTASHSHCTHPLFPIFPAMMAYTLILWRKKISPFPHAASYYIFDYSSEEHKAMETVQSAVCLLHKQEDLSLTLRTFVKIPGVVLHATGLGR